MKPRDIQDIQREIYRQLATNGSYLTDAHQGSVLYSLTRSFAAASLAGDNLLYDLSKDFFLSTATGERLDYKAAEYEVFRKPYKAASGYVLIRSRESPYTVLPREVFSDAISGVQVVVSSDENILVPTEVEVKIPVVSTTPGRKGNLKPGTRLIPGTLLQPGSGTLALEIFVGSSRTLEGEIIGGLSGGEDEESDEQLRARAQRQYLYRESCCENAILSTITADNRVNWATLHVPFPGHTQVWVELNVPDKNPVINELTEVVNLIRPVGTGISVHLIQTVAVPFEVQFQKKANTDFNELNLDVEYTIWDYCLNLEYGKSLKRGDLIYLLKQISSARFIKLIQPKDDLTPLPKTAFRPGDIIIKHDVY